LENDKVTIVIPVYNSEKFLEDSIESAINQSYDNLEIIAIDDGSTDTSAKILQKFSDKIKILTQANKGLASVLNYGIKEMNSKWFKWLSPDDILNPKAIEILIEKAKKLPTNTIVYSNWEIIDETGNKLRDFKESDYNDLESFEFNVRLLDDQHINVNTSIIPKSIFEKGCQFHDLEDPVMIDYDFFLRAGIQHGAKFHLVLNSLLKYRIHTSQLSHKKITKTLSSRDELRNNILTNLNDSEKNRYLTALHDYNKKKPLPKKTMEISLKLATHALPEWVTDRLLVLFLNKIRRTR